MASHFLLYYLLTRISSKNEKKIKKYTYALKNESAVILMTSLGRSNRQLWVQNHNSIVTQVGPQRDKPNNVAYESNLGQLPRLGKRELICLLLFTRNYVVSVWRGFLFLCVLGMGYVILLWHSLSLLFNQFRFRSALTIVKFNQDLQRALTGIQRNLCDF